MGHVGGVLQFGDDDLLGDEHDLPAEKIGPELRQWCWVVAVQGHSTKGDVRHGASYTRDWFGVPGSDLM
jgi:hypothetical protein